MLNDIVKNLLNEVSGLIPTTGAFNIRNNGQSEGRKSTENIDIVPKPNGAGLDIYVKPFTKNEDVHIPALITADGVHDIAYNDFHIGEGAEIKIIAGCGIHN
ncbi:MAG: ABC transporter permease, partial [Anaerotignum sp.]|nr:ABC transporter permease [Anaerotignum sp.]